MSAFTPRDLALHAVRLALDKGGEQVRLLEFPAGGMVFDYAVLATGRSDRQVHTIVDEIYHFCKRHQIPRMPVEGEAGWMLIDCIDVVVHAFDQERRDLYKIDKIWPAAKDVDYDKLLKKLPDPDKRAAKQA